MLPRTCAPGRVVAFGVGEQTLGQAGTTLERPFEPFDLEQVNPHAGQTTHACQAAHSTVTVFARLRG